MAILQTLLLRLAAHEAGQIPQADRPGNAHAPAQPGPQVTADRPRRNPAYSDRSRRTVTPITDLSIAQCFNLKNPSKLFIDFPILCLYDTLTFLLSSLEEYNDGKKRSLRRNNDEIASIAERALYARFIKTSFITSNPFLPQLIQFADNDKEKAIPCPKLIMAARLSQSPY